MLLGTSLSDDIGTILNGPFSDLKIKGNDGNEIKVHKNILMARSEVFKSMLLSGMKETTQEVIEFQKFSSKALLVIVEFLYTGYVTDKTLTIETVTEALICADYFLLESLIFQIIEFIEEKEDSMNIKAKFLSQHSKSLDSTNLRLCDELFDDINTVSLKLIDYHNLNENALEFLLEKIKSKNVTTSEYDLFHYVILWTAREISEEAFLFYESYLPSPEVIKNLETNPNVQEWKLNLSFHAQKNHAKYRTEIMTKSLGLLNSLDLERIHPYVFSNNEPLCDLVDPKTLIFIYRKQALLAGKYFSILQTNFQWDVYCCGRRMLIDIQSPFVVTSQSNAFEWIKTKIPISGQDLVEWDIIVEKLCDCFWVGICTSDGYNVDYNTWLGKHAYGWVFGSKGVTRHNSKIEKDKDKSKYGQKFKENDRITVHLDMKKRTCSFSVNGTNYPVAFRNLPNRVYPAVSLKAPGKARIDYSFGRR
ncbi:concanavalin A-like lectin/glucanase domain-containing protein [Glomus cerebriforme]|uniref:Concanavalin A-like lectin/glucanase domain-containing protein n=1 Tax=Glomus cerebriforme TaxID=658196 RepID=A0A397T1M0_9GLOM|nr:concanavalin A-like lectin/glucanase domain-containing protein [Glomus cerebriforme]